MMNVKRLLKFGLMAVLAIFLIGVTPALGIPLAWETSSSSEDTSSSPGDLEITRDPATGAVRFLRSRRGLDSGVDSAALTASPSSAVFTFLNRYQDLLGMPNAEKELVFRERKVDSIGMIHIRLRQVHRGVPVYGAEVRVHYAPDGKTVRAVNGRFIPHLAIRPRPTIDRDAAIAIVRTLQAGGILWEEPLLRIYSGHIDPAVSGDHLAWLVRIFDEQEPSRNLYVVDAHTGVVLTTYNELNTDRYREIYDAGHGTNLPGIQVRVEGDPATGDGDTDNAYDFLGETYDYFFDNFGRDSFDNRGATLVATVHYGLGYQNAFWNGVQMVFGDGFTVDDVTAHELTHAVTEYSANLIYRDQSGALNESFSDIFGELVDQENDTDPNDDWLIGEDLPMGAIRDMSHPPAFDDPDKVSDYVCTLSDNGGVHTNSGIPNKAAYLMAEGGAFNGYTIEGIGLEKMAHVQYRTLTVYLTPSSSLVNDYHALNQSCEDLIGTYGITPHDCEQVKNALLAVEMESEPTCPTIPIWETAYTTLFSTPSDLDLFRRYRDEFLAKSRRGRLYTRFLYKHSEEALGVLLSNPELMSQASYLIKANRGAVSEVVNGYEGVIYDTDEVVSFLNAYAKKSPMALKILAHVVKWEMLRKERQRERFLGFELK
ncbi:MAG: M4 family metallopeptidase [Promethearchaeota archaeon]